MKTFSDRIIAIFREHQILTAILGVGFLLRVSGIFWGTPFLDPFETIYHPDEGHITKGAVRFPQHVLSNQYFIYPTFFQYFLGLLTFPLRLFFDELGVPASGGADTNFYFVVTVIGRLCSVLVGTGTILLTYFFAKDIYDERRALLASTLVAFTLYHVTNSSFMTTDVLTSFLLVLFLMALRWAFLKPESSKYFIYSGVALGLLVGTKYTGAIAGLAIVVLYGHALLLRRRSSPNGKGVPIATLHVHLMLCGGSALVTFFLTTPGILFHFPSFLDSLDFLRNDLGRHDLPRTELTTWVVVFWKVCMAVGVPIALTFLWGLCFSYPKHIYELSFIAILTVFFVYFGATLFSRYVILVVPLIAMIASNGLFTWCEWKGHLFPIFGKFMIVAVVMVSFGYCLDGVYVRLHETRIQAARFIHENISAGTTVGVGYSAKNRKRDDWMRPTVDFSRYQKMDFFDYPEILMVTSYDLDPIIRALNSGKISRDYIYDQQHNKDWWEFSPPSPRIFRFYDELLNPQRTQYELIVQYEKPRGVIQWGPFERFFSGFPEFGPPEVKIYRIASIGKTYVKERAELSSRIGLYYPPNTKVRSYYSHNPDSYFDEEDMRIQEWSLAVWKGSKADLVFPTQDQKTIRIAITRSGSDIPWHIQLHQASLEIEANWEYVLRFRARASTPRPMNVAVGQAHDPWQTLGLYQAVELSEEWQDYAVTFIASLDDPHARISFNLGGSEVPVDIAEVTLQHKPPIVLASHTNPPSLWGSGSDRLQTGARNKHIEPDLPDKYFVNYRFNALGCRGSDFSIPRSQGNSRILILGDSLALGAGVHERDTMASQLEGLLNHVVTGQMKSPNYEVINCGVGGYGTQDSKRFYEVLVSKYEPDVVLLVMTPDDDQSWAENRKHKDFDLSTKPISDFLVWSNRQERLYDRLDPDYSGSVKEITQLQEMVQGQEARLGVVVFRHTRHQAWGSLIQQLSESLPDLTVPLLDLGKVLVEKHVAEALFVHKVDKHPNQKAHRIAAQSIKNFLYQDGFLERRDVRKGSLVFNSVLKENAS